MKTRTFETFYDSMISWIAQPKEAETPCGIGPFLNSIEPTPKIQSEATNVSGRMVDRSINQIRLLLGGI